MSIARPMFWPVWVLLLVAANLYCCSVQKGKDRMIDKEIIATVRELDPDDGESLDNIAESIRQKSWREPRDVVELLHSGNADDFTRAATILLSLEDLALTPVLDSLNTRSPEDYVWDMATVVDIQLANRERTAKALNRMLSDKRSVKMPELPDAEEAHVPRRVCDEAYLMLRRLLALEEDEEEKFMNEDIFLNMTDEEKDSEITRLMSSKKWTNLSDLFFDED